MHTDMATLMWNLWWITTQTCDVFKASCIPSRHHASIVVPTAAIFLFSRSLASFFKQMVNCCSIFLDAAFLANQMLQILKLAILLQDLYKLIRQNLAVSKYSGTKVTSTVEAIWLCLPWFWGFLSSCRFKIYPRTLNASSESQTYRGCSCKASNTRSKLSNLSHTAFNCNSLRLLEGSQC